MYKLIVDGEKERQKRKWLGGERELIERHLSGGQELFEGKKREKGNEKDG